MFKKLFNRDKSSPVRPAKTSDGKLVLDVAMRSDVKIGQIAKEKISGYTGVVVAIIYEIDGSILAGIQPTGLNDKGEPHEIKDYDIERLEISGPPAKMSKPNRMTIRLGARYKDKITNETGIAVRVVDFIGGCSHVCLNRGYKEDGDPKPSLIIPVERCMFEEEAVAGDMENLKTATGGPSTGAANRLIRD